MKRLFLMILLLLSSGPAYAEWVPVSGDAQGETTVYVDPDTIRRKGDMVKMWELYDYKTANTYRGSQFASRREQRVRKHRVRSCNSTLWDSSACEQSAMVMMEAFLAGEGSIEFLTSAPRFGMRRRRTTSSAGSTHSPRAAVLLIEMASEFLR